MVDNSTAIIETERLKLRHFHISDAEAMLRNWAGDPDVVRFMPYALCNSIEAACKRIDEWLHFFREAAPNSWELFAIELKSIGEVIGMIDFAVTDHEARSAEVSYQLGKAWWGEGYAAEALRALIEYCFKTVNLNRVWADFDVRNPNSGKVMQKAGMFYEGTSRQCKIRHGELVSRVHYAILSEDYFRTARPVVSVIPYEPKYRDDMMFCFLAAKDAIGGNYAPGKWSKPIFKDELLDIERNYFEKGDIFYLAIDEHDRVVGMIGTETVSPTDLWLKRLFVKPEFKGKGIGSKLLAAAEKYAIEKGVTTIHARFAGWYHEASIFYPAKGFVEAAPAEPKDYRRHMIKAL